MPSKTQATLYHSDGTGIGKQPNNDPLRLTEFQELEVNPPLKTINFSLPNDDPMILCPTIKGQK